MLEAFVVAVRTEACPETVKAQVLQSLSILAPELQRGASIGYLLSVLNPFFEDPPKMEGDEIPAYFVSLLKGLVLRLDDENVHNCIIAANGNDVAPARMPVLECAATLASHGESMVRSAARTAVLMILQLACPGVQDAAEHVMEHILAPRLALAASATIHFLQEARTTGACRWMWGDALTGRISQSNPLRWSRDFSPEELLQELHGKPAARPVIVKYLPDERQRHFKSTADAVASLSEMLSARSRLEDLMGFVQDLVCSGSPMVVAALGSQGFHTDDGGLVAFAPDRAVQS